MDIVRSVINASDFALKINLLRGSTLKMRNSEVFGSFLGSNCCSAILASQIFGILKGDKKSSFFYQ